VSAALRFASNVDASRVSSFSREVLERILARSANPSGLVTSAARVPAEQARVMYDNLERHGIGAQRRLYREPGQKVIDTYALLVGHASREAIIEAMTSTILEVGPAKVSLHCADPDEVGVVDVAPSSLEHPEAFRAEAERDPDVARVLGPPTDPALHLEIKQPKASVA
jgi:hypothetical protein